MKRTQIICTLGPASETEEIVSAMADAGMDLVRINFSHGTHADHAKKIATVRKVREKKNIPLPMILDTRGPEFRIETFANGKITLAAGDVFTFTTEEIEGTQERVSVSYKNICEDMKTGDKILLNNGLVVLEVVRVNKPDVVCRVLFGGDVSDRKSMYFPEKQLSLVYLSEQDKKDLLFAVEQGVEFILCSFVSKAQDVLDVRSFLKEHGGAHVDLIAKIENRAGVNNLEEILKVSDGILIGRGDLGVEIPYEELPDIQKNIIAACHKAGKCCIIATEMLESMIHNLRPTRAETSDVANAVYDGATALTLSAETATGDHPVHVVEVMTRIIMRAETQKDLFRCI